jgi:hypothetical protein
MAAIPTAQAAFLELSDGNGTIYRRWQSHWLDTRVNWEVVPWDYLGFTWEGLTAGASIASEQITLTLPREGDAGAIATQAVANRWVALLRIYAFSESAALLGPPAGMPLLDSAVGQVVGLTGDATTLVLSLGSALLPVGAQFPPLIATNRLIGVPCRL